MSNHYKKNSAQLVDPVHSGHHYNLIECSLFSPWYIWKISHFSLSNNHLLTYSQSMNICSTCWRWYIYVMFNYIRYRSSVSLSLFPIIYFIFNLSLPMTWYKGPCKLLIIVFIWRPSLLSYVCIFLLKTNRKQTSDAGIAYPFGAPDFHCCILFFLLIYWTVM